MKIIISGGTGFIGKALVAHLAAEGHELFLLSRRPESANRPFRGPVTALQWDGRTVGAWAEPLDGADAVINLAGEPVVGKRWTETQKTRILKSRVEATEALTAAIAKAAKKPLVLVNASAVGYYGDVENGDVTEEHPKGKGFLADVTEQWEKAARAAEGQVVRVACLRIGIVLEKDGGALQKMLPPFRFFMGGPLGSGRQWVPWIHRGDVIGVIAFMLSNPELKGPVNATAPDPVPMKAFCAALGKAMHRPSWAAVPPFMMRLLLGESSELLLTGQRAVPRKLEALRYPFRHPVLEEALADILKK